ncbi:MAG: hypothetical protein IPK99_01630 [Flavobacteriales bacterium]|nr:hypothetical protein [Flavobacteriales bacterium]
MHRDAITTLRTWLWDLLPLGEQEGLRIRGSLEAPEDLATVTITWSRLGAGEQPVRIASDGSFRISAPARGILRIRITSAHRLGRTVEVDARGISAQGRRTLARKAIDLEIDLASYPLRPCTMPFFAELIPVQDTGVLIRIHDDPDASPDPAFARLPLLDARP